MSAPLPEHELAELRRQLARAVAKVCPHWLADRADDIVQAATLKLSGLLAEGRGDRNPSYLWRVAYCATVDEIRRHRRRAEVQLDEDPVERAAVHPDEDPERARSGREIGRAIEECLAGLNEARRLAVVLHLQGHALGEAARILGWGEKRVENLVYRGLADLRRCLGAKGLEP